MVKLKTCPFCGYTAEICFYMGTYYPVCQNVTCSAEGASRSTEKEAIEVWNTRQLALNVEEIVVLMKQFSRNSGDYIPDYKYKDLAQALQDKL